MRASQQATGFIAALALIGGAPLVGCSSDNSVITPDAGKGTPGMDSGGIVPGDPDASRRFDDVIPIEIRGRDVVPNYDAIFANNPPPRMCGPDGSVSTDVMLPGGTPECPDDLVREGCPCDTVNATRSCWPGLRVNRMRGICRDGTATCLPYDELGGRWGPCENYVLPDPNARLGPASCQCFSQGRWEITNLSPCFITDASGMRVTYTISTTHDAMGRAMCPPAMTTPPTSVPVTFSTNFLTVDCTGEFTLCYTIRAGNGMSPSPNDCVVGESCTTAWYREAGVRQTLPLLPGWVNSSTEGRTCAERFRATGGYGEMSVRGVSSECQSIDNGMGQRYVFNRVTYCPSICNTMPNLEQCRNCGNGGSGNF